MRTVRDADGNRYVLLKESGESSRVRDPETGEVEYRPNEELEPVSDESPLEVAAAGVPDPVVRAVTAIRDRRSLGLLVWLVEHGPVPVRQLLETTDLCESDLLGQISEFRAAGLVRETDVDGERGYAATDDARTAIQHLRE